MKQLILQILCIAAIVACDSIDKYPGADDYKPDQEKPEPKPDNPENPTPDDPNHENPTPGDPSDGWNYSQVTTSTIGHAGLSYIWDESVIPEITIKMTKDEWNNLLAAYDKNSHNKEYFPCDITFVYIDSL